jgi:prolyl-tRNA synthetase
VVISDRGLTAGTLEYRGRTETESRAISQEQLFDLLG